MIRALSIVVALRCAAVIAHAGEAPRPDPAAIGAAIERVAKASPETRRAAVLDLADLGPSALEETRKAREAAADPEVKAALDRAAKWLLAAKMKPVLEERGAGTLTFDGQYDDLKAEGPEAPAALLLLLDDEETSPAVRYAAAHALADLRDPEILPKLRQLEADPLLAFRLREEAGILMAIIGDTSRVDRKISRLAAEVASKNMTRLRRRDEMELLSIYQSNVDLSNLYYRIRKYGPAVECYDRAIQALEEIGRRGRTSERFDRELGLTYYNTACSLSLDGKIDRAKEMLQKAVKADPTFLKSIEKDGDLRKVREAPGYEEFLREMEKPFEKKSI